MEIMIKYSRYWMKMKMKMIQGVQVIMVLMEESKKEDQKKIFQNGSIENNSNLNRVNKNMQI